jgi:hypothetical protein
MASSSKGKKGNPLDDLLSKDIPQGPLRRGAGFQLSTEEATVASPASPPKEEPQASHYRTIAPTEEKEPMPKRVNRGYKLREDLIKKCKRIALDEDRNLYEIMEEALELYLASHAPAQKDQQ